MPTNNLISLDTVPIASLTHLTVGDDDSIQRLSLFLYPRIAPLVRFFLNYAYRLTPVGSASWFGRSFSIEFDGEAYDSSLEHYGLCFEIAAHYLALEPRRFELRFLQDRLGENCEEREPKQYHITGSNFTSADAVNRHLCKAVIGTQNSSLGEWPYTDAVFIKRSNGIRYGLVFLSLNRQGDDTRIGHLSTGPAAVCADICDGQEEISIATGVCPRSNTDACSSRLNAEFPYRFFVNGDRKPVSVRYCSDCMHVAPTESKVAAMCPTCGRKLSKRNCWVPHNRVDYADLDERHKADSKHHEEQFDQNEEQKILHERDELFQLLLKNKYPKTAKWLSSILAERSVFGELTKKQLEEYKVHHQIPIAHCKTLAIELVRKRQR